MANYEDTKRDCLCRAESLWETLEITSEGTMEAKVDEIIQIAQKLEYYIYGISTDKPAELPQL